jgi:alditol oxidase
VAGTNWGGNYHYRARTVERPATLDELRSVVAAAPRVRVLGSGHSFTAIADSDAVVSLEALPVEASVDPARGTVTVSAHTRYGELASRLDEVGLALANLASLPHISVAGAVATATHGSGRDNHNLAAAVAGLELVRSDGELVRVTRGEPDFEGMVVGLGALGVVTRLTLDVEPAYAVSQRVFEGLSWEALYAHFEEIMRAGYSVSAFTRWQAVDQVWVKSRLGEPAPEHDLFGARPATVERHPIAGLDPVNCTPQLGVPGPWMERLPHFRLGFTPSAGEEIQSEYHLAIERAAEAIDALRARAAGFRELVQVSEVRTIAADELWLSPQYRRDTAAIHFTWAPRQAEVERALAEIEAALLPLGARPHWGKLFLAEAAEIAPRYERLEEFRALRARLDPRAALVNPWLERHVLGAILPA